jgi:hypothetical protein
MQEFFVGMLTGVAIFGILTVIVLLFRMHTEQTIIKNTLQLVWARLTKIEKLSEASLSAAENFVDALQRSAEGMGFVPPPIEGDDFRDLRDTFEDGIRNLEDEQDDDQENWKK